jgi:DNA-binding HxlR family transcriptional regulator
VHPVPKRSYRQYCATARALDVVGERWTLLVLRELLSGPKRFKDLLEGLPGIGTGLLSARLRALEQEGVVDRRTLPPPAASAVYELADAGRELEPVLRGLSEWGRKRLGPPRKGESFNPRWALLAMETAYDREAARGVSETYELRIDERPFHVRVEDGELRVVDGPAESATLTISTDTDTFLEAVSDGEALERALSDGRVAVEGEPAALERCLAIFAPALGMARGVPV